MRSASPLPARLVAVAGALAALLALLIGTTGTASATATTHAAHHAVEHAAGRHEAAHSAPIWVPLHTGFGLDCAGRNPGCTSRRDFYSVDIIPTGQFGPNGSPSDAEVYSMGAGVLHIGDAHGASCSSGVHSFGTWVWIDHGHGVFSRYGHLSKILVKNRTRVAAGTPIGVVGTTGKAKNCTVNYLDFMIDHGRVKDDHAHRFRTLQACTPDGTRQTWPAQAALTKAPSDATPVHFDTWGQVAHGTQFPASGGSC